jgi:hypothetical protein
MITKIKTKSNFLQRVNDHPQSGWLGIARLGRVFPPYGRGKTKACQCFLRCGCNPSQANLKTANEILFKRPSEQVLLMTLWLFNLTVLLSFNMI